MRRLSRRSPRSFDAVLLHLLAQGVAVDAQHLGGAALVAGGVVEHHSMTGFSTQCMTMS